METVEERNLNRLRRGKMMLELAELKKSYVLAFALVFFFGSVGAHRFYLGQVKFGLFILCCSVLFVSLFHLGFEDLATGLGSLYVWFILSEIILIPVYTGRVNRRLKDRLMKEYDVQDYKI